jgi:carboxymethylenebutenolidase
MPSDKADHKTGECAIHTGSAGLRCGPASIPVGSERVPAYCAAPADAASAPVVLVVQEIFGVHEYIKDVCRRLAKLGYFAVAPELYVRQGDPSQVAAIPDLMREIVSKVPDAQVLGDLDACERWAAENGGDTQRLGITGFCWGGRIAWLYAAHNPRLKAAVAWYGRLAGDATANNPRHPVDVAAGLRAPVLGLYAGADAGIPLAAVEQMQQALAEAAAGGNRNSAASRFIVYPDAPHAFHSDYRPNYRPQPAEDGWRRCVEWFRSHGVC